MKINNKGVTIVELLVSLALLSVVLMFLYKDKQLHTHNSVTSQNYIVGR